MTEQRQGEDSASSRPRHPERPCLNCGDPTYGEFCPNCGQHKVDVQVSVRTMVRDLLEDELLLGKRLPHTLGALLFRPGFLTSEVLKGRIVRYVLPFRLYLASSVMFFLVLSFVSVGALASDGSVEVRPDSTTAEAVEVDSEDLAEIDSAIAELDAQLEAPDANAAQAIGLRTARTVLVGQRERLVREQASGEDFSVMAPGDSTNADAPPGVAGEDEDGWMDVGTVNTGSSRIDAAIRKRLDRWSNMDQDDALQDMLRTALGVVPTIMFILLPVFAGVLKLLYIRHRRYYAEHMIFVLHAHAFIFVVFTLMILARSWIGGWPLALLCLWVFVYIYLAMRRVYGQSHLKTFVKYWTLGWMYFWILLVGVPLLLVLSVVLLPA